MIRGNIPSFSQQAKPANNRTSVSCSKRSSATTASVRNTSVLVPQLGSANTNTNLLNDSFLGLRSNNSFSQTTRSYSIMSYGTPNPPVTDTTTSRRVSSDEGNPLANCMKMTVKEILDSKDQSVPLQTIEPDKVVYKAIQQMSKYDCGAILVAKDGDKSTLVGIFTERDYMNKIIVKGLSSKSTYARDVMTPNPICVNPRYTLEDATRLMITHNFRHLPVLENENDYSSKLIGVISSEDVIEQLVKGTEDCEHFDIDGNLSDVFNTVARTSSVGIFVDQDDKVIHALQMMEKNKCGAILVHSGTRLVGIFTERDYLHRIILKGKSSLDTPVGKVMSPEAFCVHAHTSVKEALRLFVEKGIRNLPILNLSGDEFMEERMPIGMISSHNVMKFIYKHHNGK